MMYFNIIIGILRILLVRNELLLAALGTQLDTHTVGYLTYKGGLHGSMSTSIIRNTAQSYTSVALQFGLVNSFVSLNYMYKLQERKMKLRTSLK